MKIARKVSYTLFICGLITSLWWLAEMEFGVNRKNQVIANLIGNRLIETLDEAQYSPSNPIEKEDIDKILETISVKGLAVTYFSPPQAVGDLFIFHEGDYFALVQTGDQKRKNSVLVKRKSPKYTISVSTAEAIEIVKKEPGYRFSIYYK